MAMAQVARHAPSPNPAISRPAPAPPPPSTTPAVRRPDTPGSGEQITGRISGNVTNCQEASKHIQNEVHHSRAMSSAKGMLKPDSSEKQRMPKSSGGSYSKPDARVKLIPAEEITYVQLRKPYCRTVGPAGLQKKHCRRSITPPPSSRKVSVVPMPSVPSYKLSLSPKRLDTAENADSLVHKTSSVTHQIASVKNPAPPSCKSSQPSSTSLNTGAIARNSGLMGTTEEFSRYYGSHNLHSQWPDSLAKEAAIYSDSPSPKRVLAPRSSEDHLGTKAGNSSKSVCAPETEEFSSPTSVFLQRPTVVYPDRIRTAAPILRKHPRSTAAPVLQSSVVESALLNPTPVVDERSRELCPDGTRTAAAPVQHVSPSPSSLLSERSTGLYPNSKSGLKEAVVNHLSPTPTQVLAPCSSEGYLGTKGGPPSTSMCTPEKELCTRSCNLDTRTIAGPVLQSPVLESALLSRTSLLGETSTEVYSDRTGTAVPTQQELVAEHVLPSPTSLLSERSADVHPNSSTGLCSSNNLLNPKCDMVSLQHKSIPQTRNLQSATPSQCSTSINRDISSEFHHKDVQETGAPAILHTKLHRKHYQSEAPWKGNFHVTGELEHICDGIEAHLPFQIFVRVYEASKKMPQILKLEAVALSQLWPKKFRMKPPDGEDIGLCFISSHQRPHRSFDHLLEKMSSHVGLWTNIGDTELSIFSSKLLPPDYQIDDFVANVDSQSQRTLSTWKHGKFYFWGIFGKRMRKKRHRNSHITGMKNSNRSQPNEDPADKSEDTVAKLDVTESKETESGQPESGIAVDARVGKERDVGKSKETRSTVDVKGDKLIVSDKSDGPANLLDLTGGSKTDRVNESAMPGTSNSYSAASCAAPAASLLNGYCNRDTADKNTISVADSPSQLSNIASSGSDLKLDRPPGFSLKNDRVNECEVVLETPDSNSASNGAAIASLLNGCCSHGSANKSTSSLPVSSCQIANISWACSNLMLDTPNGFSLKTDRIDGCDMVLRTPNSNPPSSCTAPIDSPLSRCFGRDWNKSTFSLSDSLCQPANTSSVGSHLMLDTHSGFSQNVPPGFTEADRRAEANDVPYVGAPPNLVRNPAGSFNNIPPGFTVADRRLPTITCTEPETGVSTPVTEKKPLIKFSLNVPSLLKKEILPGFTMPNAVKKEPESPAVDKATEKLTPSPLASGASSVRKAGKLDGMRITRDEATVEDDGNSEEREFPKIRRLSELYGTPRKCTEVCRPVTSNLADKFGATEQPEKRRHQAKRGMQEPPEPSIADTANRLKVNGRLALINGVDPQTNQDQENGR